MTQPPLLAVMQGGEFPSPTLTANVQTLLLIRERVHIQRETRLRRINFWGDSIRHQPRAAAPSSRCHCNVLFTSDTVRHGESLHCGCEFRFPKHLSILHVDGLEHLVPIAHECEPTGRRQHGREERGSLLK